MVTEANNMLKGRRDYKVLTGSKTGSFVTGPLLKGFLMIMLMLATCGQAMAQRALKISRMRKVTWDSYNRAWSPWPATWSSYEKGNEPIITITRLDDNGYQFKVDMLVSSQNFSFNVSYNGFDEKNNWTKYMDPNGDEVAIVGSTMSKLSQYGWPDSVVQIYFWIYSSSMGLELE